MESGYSKNENRKKKRRKRVTRNIGEGVNAVGSGWNVVGSYQHNVGIYSLPLPLASRFGDGWNTGTRGEMKLKWNYPKTQTAPRVSKPRRKIKTRPNGCERKFGPWTIVGSSWNRFHCMRAECGTCPIFYFKLDNRGKIWILLKIHPKKLLQ